MRNDEKPTRESRKPLESKSHVQGFPGGTEIAPKKESIGQKAGKFRPVADAIRMNDLPEESMNEWGKVFKSNDCWLSLALLIQAANAAPPEGETRLLDGIYTLSLLNAVKPQNELEGLLATQMSGVHSLAMEFLRRANYPNQTPVGVTENIERANKLLRTFTAQLDSLNRLRGKGQQKVIVEHVHVHKGGQAIVGEVSHPGKGGGGRGE